MINTDTKDHDDIDIDKAVVSTPNALKLTPVFGDDELPDVDAPEQAASTAEPSKVPPSSLRNQL